MKRLIKAIFKWGMIVTGAGFLLSQFVPYGRDHSNPPVQNEPEWDSLETRALVERACLDCHSNETVWPWYSNVAPISWLVQRDTMEGREELNFSEWGTRGEGEEGEEMRESILEGEMPLPVYLITHPEARLSELEQAQLIEGLLATAGDDPSFGSEEEGEEDDD